MDEKERRDLERAVEVHHPGRASLVSSVPVREKLREGGAWEGLIHVFELRGNEKASRAYAWWSAAEDGRERSFCVVLHRWKVASPADAVRAWLGPLIAAPSAPE